MNSDPTPSNYSTTPLTRPPPGQVSNFIDPPSISWSGRLSIYLTLPIALVAVVLRIYVRVGTRQMGIDDYLLFAAAVTTFAFCGVLLPSLLDDTLGRHAWDIPVTAITPTFFKHSLAEVILYSASATFIKVSVLALCFRIFSPSRRATTFIRLGLVVIPVFYVTTTAVNVYYFVPHAGDGGWGSPKNNARSGIPSRIVNTTQGLGSALSDFYVLAIPICMVLRLNLPFRRRIGVACIFLTGLLSCAISTVGFVYRYEAFIGGGQNDNRWLSIKFEALSVAELNIGIVCASMPISFVLFKTFAKRTEAGYKYLITHVLSRTSRIRIQDSAIYESGDVESHQLNSLYGVPETALNARSPSLHKDFRSQHSMDLTTGVGETTSRTTV